MRQAIEEGFILDVLKNYTPYKLAFQLTHEGRDWTDAEVEQSAAVKGLMRWVRLHPYNISQKVAIVVEHFIDNVQPLLGGHAKAMVVTASRLEAVRFKRAIDQYIQEHRYAIGTLVAFSGEVLDEQSGEPVTERSAHLNPGLAGKDMREAFATEAFQILLVANKFQTGFDQPLLCGMYVDKRLAGIQAVQTLSRLNRAYNGAHGLKDTTYVLDFVNEPDEVLAAFQTYYETAELAGVTDPNLILELKAKLDASGHYDEFEVERVVNAELNPQATQAMLVAAIEPVADRLLKHYQAAKAKFDGAAPDGPEHQAAKDALDALLLFKRDHGLPSPCRTARCRTRSMVFRCRPFGKLRRMPQAARCVHGRVERHRQAAAGWPLQQRRAPITGSRAGRPAPSACPLPLASLGGLLGIIVRIAGRTQHGQLPVAGALDDFPAFIQLQGDLGEGRVRLGAVDRPATVPAGHDRLRLGTEELQPQRGDDLRLVAVATPRAAVVSQGIGVLDVKRALDRTPHLLERQALPAPVEGAQRRRKLLLADRTEEAHQRAPEGFELGTCLSTSSRVARDGAP